MINHSANLGRMENHYGIKPPAVFGNQTIIANKREMSSANCSDPRKN